jgi:hypothetical protein
MLVRFGVLFQGSLLVDAEPLKFYSIRLLAFLYTIDWVSQQVVYFAD